MKTLVLIPNSFPLGGVTEKPFILPEIKYLAAEFDHVIIAPLTPQQHNSDISGLPENVTVSNLLTLKPTLTKKIKGLTRVTRHALTDIFLSPKNIKDSIAYSAYVGMSLGNLEHLMRKYDLDATNTLFYTFWFDFTTTALSEMPGLRYVTRTHRYDLYENRDRYISPFWRKRTLRGMEMCYPVAKAGEEYLQSLYPAYRDKISFRLLGTSEPGRLNPEKDVKREDDLTFLSIARLAPEKGVDRQISFLNDFARSHPELRMRYLHIGDGPLMESLKLLAKDTPPNLKIEFAGSMDNDYVRRLLEDTHIDLTLLLSRSEGLPVSLMESMSYGIPFVATDVGGIRELVPECGEMLIPEKPTSGDFSLAVETILNDSTIRGKVRKAWEWRYSADMIRKEFASELRAMI